VRLSPADCLGLWGNVAPGPHVCVEITDTGRGLGPDAQARLFRELFFTNKPRHRGLGLATVYGVLRCHRGGFCLAARPGGGVTARVYLPLAPGLVSGGVASGERSARPRPGNDIPPEEGRHPTDHAPVTPHPSPGDILVVDDDPGVLEMVSRTLRREGYRVQTAASAAEAMAVHAASRGQPFRLVLSDVVMEPTSGVELARQLLTHDTNLRLLFMSGEGASREAVRRDFGGRGVGLLPKPFAIEGLLGAVREALQS
jgi:CheY-like chemotaxis protein